MDLPLPRRDSILFLLPHLHLASGPSFQFIGRDKIKAGVKEKNLPSFYHHYTYQPLPRSRIFLNKQTKVLLSAIL